MIDDARAIVDYLPYFFSREEEREYVVFLHDAFETNYSNGKYQFAFIAYHMLFMSMVYCCIWKIKLIHEADFYKALIGFGKEKEKELLGASSPFTFHTLNERSVFRFFKLIGCDNDKIGRYQKIVDHRNESAHSNGNIYLGDKESLDDKLTSILKYADELQDTFRLTLERYYEDFLRNSSQPEETI